MINPYLNDLTIFIQVVNAPLKYLLFFSSHELVGVIYLISVVPAGGGNPVVQIGLANNVVWTSMPAISLPKVGLFDLAIRVLVVDPNVFLLRLVNEGGGGERSA